MNNSKLLQAYTFFAAFFVYGLLTDHYLLMNLTKAIPMFLLMAYLILTGNTEKFIIIALFFSMLGDIFLLKSIDMFMAGLASFLIAHLFYIFAFYKRNPKINFSFSIIYYLLGAYIFYILQDSLGDLRIAVAIYIFVITSMAWFAKNQAHINPAYKYAYYGAMFFIISDTILALNRFSATMQYAGVVVIVTYYLAQFLIFKSTQKA